MGRAVGDGSGLVALRHAGDAQGAIPNWRAWLAEKAAPSAVPEVAAEPSHTKGVAGVLLGAAVLSLASYWLLRRK